MPSSPRRTKIYGYTYPLTSRIEGHVVALLMFMTGKATEFLPLQTPRSSPTEPIHPSKNHPSISPSTVLRLNVQSTCPHASKPAPNLHQSCAPTSIPHHASYYTSFYSKRSFCISVNLLHSRLKPSPHCTSLAHSHTACMPILVSCRLSCDRI